MGQPQPLTGRVRDLGHAGDGVVETDAGLLFVPGALPGETVVVRPTGKVRGAQRGELLKVVEPSPDRVPPPCQDAGRCGGCPLMNLSAPAQRELKRQRVQRSLQHAGVTAVEVVMEEAGEALGYRRRARLGWKRRGTGCLIGYRQGRTHRLMEVAGCPILEAPLQQALKISKALLAPHLQGEGSLDLHPGFGGSAVNLSTDMAQSTALYGAAEALANAAGISGVSLRVEGASAQFGEPGLWTEGADAKGLRGPSASFAQANAAVNGRLAALVLELAQAQGGRVLELYAGHGNLTTALAAQAAELWAVESDEAAARACRDNLLSRQLQNVHVAPVEASLGVGKGPIDVVVLDPPRSGALEIMEALSARKPKRIVYVSCDPGTLSRDVKVLLQRGYHVDRAHTLDMFPHTGHVETVLRLVPGPVA